MLDLIVTLELFIQKNYSLGDVNEENSKKAWLHQLKEGIFTGTRKETRIPHSALHPPVVAPEGAPQDPTQKLRCKLKGNSSGTIIMITTARIY